jgi:hypothetical protein
MKRCGTVFCTFCFVVALFAQPILAQDTFVKFNQTTQSIEYEITNGDAVTYDVKLHVDGCVETLNPADTLVEAPGPDVSGSIPLACVEAGASGHIRVEICEGIVCFAYYDFYFRCHSDCVMTEVGGVPSSSLWGLVGLTGLLVLTSIYVLYRRKRVTA